uniref:Uncharacterized protein n=1 Tax=Trypanosoma vivax (strain Y486) TaxID=1055687 RepID=G0U9S1_TRYVY|nr:hypothetical protein TVY486_1100370 [Trypanosoma vivax Y486]
MAVELFNVTQLTRRLSSSFSFPTFVSPSIIFFFRFFFPFLFFSLFDHVFHFYTTYVPMCGCGAFSLPPAPFSATHSSHSGAADMNGGIYYPRNILPLDQLPPHISLFPYSQSKRATRVYLIVLRPRKQAEVGKREMGKERGMREKSKSKNKIIIMIINRVRE